VNAWVVVAVAVGPALVGGPVMWVLTRFDKRNSEQHRGNMDVLDRIEGKVDKLDERVDGHIEWHMKKD